MSAVKPGERFGCAECGTEVVVIRPGESVPLCCGKGLENASGGLTAAPGRPGRP